MDIPALNLNLVLEPSAPVFHAPERPSNVRVVWKGLKEREGGVHAMLPGVGVPLSPAVMSGNATWASPVKSDGVDTTL